MILFHPTQPPLPQSSLSISPHFHPQAPPPHPPPMLHSATAATVKSRSYSSNVLTKEYRYGSN